MSSEQFGQAYADREPTKEENRAAERAERVVDVDKVAEHEEHMNSLGANVSGEGQIEPESDE
ncbi:MAG: hypothetical protein ABI862_10525 [Ilumatobacteraceae bacterium]